MKTNTNIWRHPSSAVLTAQKVDPSIPRLTPHDLRHTAVSLAISSGANVKAVQRMLGHASAAMTLDTYADLFDDDLDAVASRINEAMPLVALPAGPQTCVTCGDDQAAWLACSLRP